MRWGAPAVVLLLASCGSVPVILPVPGDAGTSCGPARPCATPLVCDPSGECVECLEDAHCSGARPACDGVAKRCVACRGTLGCTAPEVCSPTSPVCVLPCTSGSPNACPGYAGGCRANVCAACIDDDDCGANRRCDLSLGRCVGCLVDEHCDGATPRCERTTGTCVACVANRDCAAGTSCFQGACR